MKKFPIVEPLCLIAGILMKMKIFRFTIPVASLGLALPQKSPLPAKTPALPAAIPDSPDQIASVLEEQ